MKQTVNDKKSGFTLIELLIVIAIALPNFLEARIRATITKVRAELRTLSKAPIHNSAEVG